MKAYGFGDSELMDQSTGAEHTPGNVSQESPTEMIGFRLPDHERSDYPEKAQKESVLDASETTEMPVVPDQPIDGDSGKSAEGTQENPENEGDNRG